MQITNINEFLSDNCLGYRFNEVFTPKIIQILGSVIPNRLGKLLDTP